MFLYGLIVWSIPGLIRSHRYTRVDWLYDPIATGGSDQTTGNLYVQAVLPNEPSKITPDVRSTTLAGQGLQCCPLEAPILNDKTRTFLEFQQFAQPYEAFSGAVVNLAADVDDLAVQMTKGRILFNPPKTMRQGDKENVVVRLSKSSKENLQAHLAPTAMAVTQEVAVAPLMSVELIGDDGFRVEQFQKSNQFVASDRYSEWTFIVTAVKSGIHRLHLILITRIRIADSEQIRTDASFDQDVNVLIGYRYAGTKFVSNHWQWLATTIFIPMVVFWWKGVEKARVDRKADEKAEQKSVIIVP